MQPQSAFRRLTALRIAPLSLSIHFDPFFKHASWQGLCEHCVVVTLTGYRGYVHARAHQTLHFTQYGTTACARAQETGQWPYRGSRRCSCRDVSRCWASEKAAEALFSKAVRSAPCVSPPARPSRATTTISSPLSHPSTSYTQRKICPKPRGKRLHPYQKPLGRQGRTSLPSPPQGKEQLPAS